MFKKPLIYLIKQTPFNHLELWQAAIFKPVDLGNRYIHPLKNRVVDSSFETKFFLTLRDVKSILLRVVLLHLTLLVPGDFSMLMYQGGGILLYPPLENDFIQGKNAFFCYEMKFGIKEALFLPHITYFKLNCDNFYVFRSEKD